MKTAESTKEMNVTFDEFKTEVLEDYRLARVSRELSLLGRREVLTGKAKFGIFGDGKELAQIALAKQFRNGDFRSGYYRDQTFMMAIGQMEPKHFFAGLYANTDLAQEPFSAGRQMGGHFSSHLINEDGSWKNLMEQKNSSADASPTASQMPRLLGLALASKLYRQNKELAGFTNFSVNGNEVAFGTIGDASTSEGMFFETLNAAGVLQVPMVMSVWDDGHGISVPKKYQTTKESISELLKGLEATDELKGFKIYKVKGWDYPGLCQTYEKAVAFTRENHIPCLVHVEEVTQPQGHSTSGSHERYKSEERLQWEIEYDGINQFKNWIISYKKEYGEEIATEEELNTIESDAKKFVRDTKKEAWADYTAPFKAEQQEVVELLEKTIENSSNKVFVEKLVAELKSNSEPSRKDIISTVKKIIRATKGEDNSSRKGLVNWLQNSEKENHTRYSSHLLSETEKSALNVPVVLPKYENDTMEDGRIILKENFDKLFEKYPELVTFGEDTGKIGGVNQSMEGMQDKYGELRVTDTGIRDCSRIGQGIGLA